jgi:hypothetical protein
MITAMFLDYNDKFGRFNLCDLILIAVIKVQCTALNGGSVACG